MRTLTNEELLQVAGGTSCEPSPPVCHKHRKSHGGHGKNRHNPGHGGGHKGHRHGHCDDHCGDPCDDHC